MPLPLKADGIEALRASITRISILIRTFQTNLQDPTSSTLDIQNPPNPLRLLSDASSILKAQTTKLSLLVLNKPFTPSAITFILNSLSSTCLPALMSALELCNPGQWTTFLHEHIRTSLFHIFNQLSDLITSIPQDEHGIDISKGRPILATTGVLWESCDNLINLASMGVIALAAQKADSYHALVKDAIAELGEWDPNELNDDDLDSVSSDEDSLEGTFSRQRLEEISHEDTTNRIPNNPSEPCTTQSHCPSSESNTTAPSTASASTIPILLAHTLRTLRLIRLLYPALQKRRILTFPSLTPTTPHPTTSQIQRLNTMMAHLRHFTEEADEVATALYMSDKDQVARRLKGLEEMAGTCVQAAKISWGGGRDEFSEWVENWEARMGEMDAI